MTLNKKQKIKKKKLKDAEMSKPALDRLINLLKSIDLLEHRAEVFLRGIMKPKFCAETHDLHEQGTRIDESYFISTGYMLIYYIENGVKYVLRICGPDEIVSANSFLTGLKSKYSIKVFKDTYLLSITEAQMEHLQKEIPSVAQLTLKTIRSFEEKELERNKIISAGGQKSVLYFYKIYPGLLYSRIIGDDDIANYLLMSRSNLSALRNDLIRRGLLP
ncbi:Crp/Fnr family transcriptional regulator [Pedobacter sp.]|jgi:CRP-like cAMP-binding protein|uniref:Crp/Fnr family transcriptional regulator n=1 Tax=Pedobacter sp. TaxID=1411316 RepID=UPI002B6C240F|nr:cyclic nucleotide-binding domain-containing protein [Pedobacter sp.]HWW38062.1 cyclic nucleotide-binding domain-containing protein [Pedobacter sp.]